MVRPIYLTKVVISLIVINCDNSYAFVEFVSETDAEKALTTLNNLCIDGSNIKIEV